MNTEGKVKKLLHFDVQSFKIRNETLFTIVFCLTLSSFKQFVCFVKEKQNSPLPKVLYIRCEKGLKD